jgi:hypothetical protein
LQGDERPIVRIHAGHDQSFWTVLPVRFGPVGVLPVPNECKA